MQRHDYSIEEKNGRFIVWRLDNDRKLRQGSYDSYDEADARIERSIINLSIS